MSYADATTVTMGILLAGNMMGHNGALLVHYDCIHTDCIYRNGDTIVDQRMGLSNEEKAATVKAVKGTDGISQGMGIHIPGEWGASWS